MNPNDYLNRRYGPLPCWPLVADVYARELGRGVTAFQSVNNSVRAITSAFSVAIFKNPDGFIQASEPVDLALVLLAATPALKIHHCGVYWQGSVLHALEDGVVYQDLASLSDAYRRMEFWRLA